MTDTTYSELINAISTGAGHAQTAHIPANWMQGRTTYGGLTAALCLNAALPLSGGRPIRSAQIAFVGPVSGDVVTTPTLLREGKNTAFVQTRMMGEAGVAAEATFTFGAARDSALEFAHLPMPDVPKPKDIEPYFGDNPMRPAFTDNFDMLRAGGALPFSGAETADLMLWMRHKDTATPLDATALLAIGDAPPPAAMTVMPAPGRISSMTWMAEFLTDNITAKDGWCLARHTAETARDGYTNQRMVMWNTDGTPLMIGRQAIAVFV
jgi:acyl-CoA thioesterase